MSDTKLSDKQLNELIPTLAIEEIFLIEYQKDNKWYKLLEFDDKKLSCNLCNLTLFIPALSDHCKSEKHKTNLSKIQRVYHPRRTQPKSSNEKHTDNEIKHLEEKAKQKAKNLADEAKGMLERTLENKLRKLCLTTNVKEPRQVYVNVGLPLNQLVQLEYLVNGKWKPLLKPERLSEKSRFYCNICNVWCGGVITVGAHFGGNSHMNLQLEVQRVRHKTHKHLSKYCRYSYNTKFFFSINEKGRKIYKERVDKWLSDFNKLSGAVEDLEEGLDDSWSEIGKLSVENVEKSSNDKLAQSNNSKEQIAVVNKASTTLNKVSTVTAKISERTDKIEKPTAVRGEEGLIGVEYVIKLLRSHNAEAVYECVLCEIVFSECKMQTHLISHDHRLKYCDVHYADTMKKYKDMIGHMRYNDFYCCISPLLSRLAEAIEKEHSRAVPCAIEEAEFLKARANYVAQMYAVRHACQDHGPSFSKTVRQEDIDELKKNRHNYKEPPTITKTPCRFNVVPSVPYLGLFVFNINDRLDICKHKVTEAKRSIEREKNGKSPIRTAVVRTLVKRERSPDSPTTKMWKQYDKEVALEKKRIDRKYDEYRKQPEGHPLYEQEWNRFWKQRRDELIAEGIDHRTYNYQAEWVHYFRNRLEELFCEAVRQVKDKVRAHLRMPVESDNINQQLQQQQQQQSHKRNSNLSVENVSAAKIQRFGADPFGLQQQQQQQQHMQSQFGSNNRQIGLPVQSQFSIVSQSSNIAPVPAPVPEPLRMQQVTTASNQNKVQSAINADDKPNVIHVLRLMTAMEDHLGSLGSKIMDLFTKALQLEKKCNGNAQLLEKCVLTADNCNLLEVSMEKLKGVLFAGLLEGNKANSISKIIKSTDELLTYADIRGWRDVSADATASDHDNKNNNSNSNNASIELQKLLNAIQNKNTGQNSQQKSLSDTLKELMGGKTIEIADSPPNSPRPIKEERFRNSSPPSQAMERNVKPNFMNSNRDMKSNQQFKIDSENRHIDNKSNVRRQSEQNFDMRNQSVDYNSRRSNDFDISPYQQQQQHQPRSNERNSTSAAGPSAGEMRLMNFNQYGGGSNSSKPFTNVNLSLNTNSLPYGSVNLQNSRFPNALPSVRANSNMLLQQFGRNLGNNYSNRN